MTANKNDKLGTTSRRGFLGCGLGAALGLGASAALPSSLLAAAEPSAKAKMRLGLATYNWGRDWDIPTLVANCHKAGLTGVELRTSSKHAHGVEVTLNKSQRAEVRKKFADSPVRLVSIASGERMDWPQPEKLKEAIEAAKAHFVLSHDLGCDIVRVFPNQFHPDVPREKTIEQIARAANELGVFAAGLGQEVSLEAHGSAGELPSLRAVMDRVTQPSVRIRLNCDVRDTKGEGFEANFNLVKNCLSRAIHLHDLRGQKYPYQLMVDLLVKAKWAGCALLELDGKPEDRVAELAELRRTWEAMIDKASG